MVIISATEVVVSGSGVSYLSSHSTEVAMQYLHAAHLHMVYLHKASQGAAGVLEQPLPDPRKLSHRPQPRLWENVLDPNSHCSDSSPALQMSISFF